MGLDNRDYMRDESTSYSAYGGGKKSAMDDVVKTLIIVNVVVLLLQLFVKVPETSLLDFLSLNSKSSYSQTVLTEKYYQLRQSKDIKDILIINEWFALDSEKVFHGQIWRLTTYDFLHSTGSIWHIVFNMLILFMAGKPVAARYGQKEFLWFYLLAGIFSAAFYIAWGFLNRESVAAVGASGAVSAVLLLYAMNWPQQRWYVYGIIPVPVIMLVLISAGMDLLPMLRQISGGGRSDNIAHSAHIGGMLFGFLYYKGGWKLSRLIPNSFSLSSYIRFKKKSKLKIHRPQRTEAPESTPPPRQPIPPKIAQRVDEILEKISRSGEESLTTEERDFLHESSRKYR